MPSSEQHDYVENGNELEEIIGFMAFSFYLTTGVYMAAFFIKYVKNSIFSEMPDVHKPCLNFPFLLFFLA